MKVRRTSAYFLDRYAAQRLRYARARRVMSFLGELPRYVLELVFVGGAAVLTVVSLAQGNSATTLTTLALFLAAGFRMLPSLVRIVASLSRFAPGAPGSTSSSTTCARPTSRSVADGRPAVRPVACR